MPTWAVHAFDGAQWRTYDVDPNTKEAAQQVADGLRSLHPRWAIKVVDEAL